MWLNSLLDDREPDRVDRRCPEFSGGDGIGERWWREEAKRIENRYSMDTLSQ